MGRKRKRRYIEPFDMKIESLGKKGMGIGIAPDGKPVYVKPAPPGATIKVAPHGYRKGKWKGRRLEMVEKPEAWEEPSCKLFGLCGGCTLQELELAAQREAKLQYALKEIASGMDLSKQELLESVHLHPLRGAKEGYRYRNKVEFSFGTSRFLSQEKMEAGEPIDGRFLGFHAPGRFDRIVDSDHCWLISDASNLLLTCAREHTLKEELPMPWNPKEHTGFWRHLMLREGFATGDHMVVLYTASAETAKQREAVQRLADALMAQDLPEGHTLKGFVWIENDKISDVAQGDVTQVWGQDWFEEKLGDIRYRLSYRSFFQTSTKGAVILYDTIAESLKGASGRLYDLYCGIGSIGLYMAKDFEEIVGVEEIPEAVEDAKHNAALNNIQKAEYFAAKMENTLSVLPDNLDTMALLVDPPRSGLHPKVARTLACSPGDLLVYVACHPGSLGRDAAILATGGWQMTDLWSVDLFPQTGHIEMVGRFVRKSS